MYELLHQQEILILNKHEANSAVYYCKTIEQAFPVILCTSDAVFFGYNLLRTTGNETFNATLFETIFAEAIDWRHNNPEPLRGMSEAAIFEAAGLPFIAPEIRDVPKIIYKIQQTGTPQLLKEQEIRGILHAHSTWSDGTRRSAQCVARGPGLERLCG